MRSAVRNVTKGCGAPRPQWMDDVPRPSVMRPPPRGLLHFHSQLCRSHVTADTVLGRASAPKHTSPLTTWRRESTTMLRSALRHTCEGGGAAGRAEGSGVAATASPGSSGRLHQGAVHHGPVATATCKGTEGIAGSGAVAVGLRFGLPSPAVLPAPQGNTALPFLPWHPTRPMPRALPTARGHAP